MACREGRRGGPNHLKEFHLTHKRLPSRNCFTTKTGVSMSRHRGTKPPSALKYPEAKIYDVEKLLQVKESSDSFIVENLLRKGDQLLLAGPPKTGKSYLASELALALSIPFSEDEGRRTLWHHSAQETGEAKTTGAAKAPPKHFSINPKPQPRDSQPGSRGWKVLVFSLEMNVPEVARRLGFQAKKFVAGVERLKEGQKLEGLLKEAELLHVFGLPGKDGILVQDLSILEVRVPHFGAAPEFLPGPHAQGLKQVINQHQPDVVIFDSLIQLHNLPENDNVQMKAVMRELRRISSYQKDGRTESVAHIVLHHTRKPSAKESGDPSAAMMRGAGSIHAAADLVMTINKEPGAFSKVRVSFSARSAHPPEGHFIIEPKTQTHAWVHENTDSGKKPAIEKKRDRYQAVLSDKAGPEWQEVASSWFAGLDSSRLTRIGHIGAVAEREKTGLELRNSNPVDDQKPQPGSLGFWVRRASP